MINNICEQSKPAKAFKATITSAAIEDSRYYRNNKANDVANANNNKKNASTGGVGQTTYGHGIWYSEIIDGVNNANNNQQQYSNKAIVSNNNNNSNSSTENVVNKNVWLPMVTSEVPTEQQQQSHCARTNNECDIIIVDIENEDDHDDDDADGKEERQRQYHHHQQQQLTKFLMNANIKFPQKHPTICDNERDVAKNNITCNTNNITQYLANDGHVNTFDNVDSNNDNVAKDEDEDDSLASMETLSDNVSIWIDGEKHWVAGVDANTTCSELIWALLNYQNGQESLMEHHPTFAVATITNEQNITTTVTNNTNRKQYENYELQKQQQHLPKGHDKNITEFKLRMSTKEDSSIICADNKPNIQNTAKTNNTSNDANSTNNTNTNTTTTSTITTSINQSMPINTKENYKIIQNSTLTAETKLPIASTATPIISSLASVSETTPPLTLLPLTLPPGIASVSQLATEYVIVKQYHHCEEYLDGSTKVFDVLPPRNGSNKKECELLLRHLGPAPAAYINNTTPQLSSLISTDKDSGMGSPVGSARSAKFRRRKHKSSQWLAQSNTLHPKLSRCSANERLMKIILAQDETIQLQLSLLREKERQITKIEEEKHRKRERELGKNYLLETYLNGLDEAECEPEIQDSEEIFIDEPYQRAAATAISTTNPRQAIQPSAVILAAGAFTNKIPSAGEALSAMAKYKLKEKEVKKEKKKKRHKEKQTKDEEIQAKEFNLKANKNKDKEKVDKQQQQQHESKATDGVTIQDNDNEQEIEMQILWLEKIYSLNKQLQKEEELAAKLHAKVRKHQLRKTQHTQREAQMEIDKLDNNLALQCGDIRKIEANLMQTNEQLQKKLLLLERLSVEYLGEQRENETHNKQEDIQANAEKQPVKTYTTKDFENPLKNDTNTLLTNLEKSLDIQKLSLNNIKSKEEVIKLEKIIAKPSKDSQPVNAEAKETKQNLNIMTQNVSSNPVIGNTTSIPTNQRILNITPLPLNTSIVFATDDNQQQQQQHHLQQQQQQYQEQQYNHHHQQDLRTALPATISLAVQTTYIDEERTDDAVSTFIDKNMLSSLHVQNAKTIKKQMFHTQTTAAAAPAAAFDSTTSSPTQPTKISSAFPKRQFQQTTQQHMPLASTFPTSRPQNLHQIQATNIVIVQHPLTSSSSCSSHLTSTTSSPLELAPVTTSVIMGQHPPSATSPSPSIMAMNTVDISQLGTLV